MARDPEKLTNAERESLIGSAASVAALMRYEVVVPGGRLTDPEEARWFEEQIGLLGDVEYVVMVQENPARRTLCTNHARLAELVTAWVEGGRDGVERLNATKPPKPRGPIPTPSDYRPPVGFPL